MASRLVDSQVSQSVSFAGGSTTATSTTPTLYATLGLNTAAALTGLITEFSTSIGITVATAAVTATITINRIAAGVTTTVYTAAETIPVGTTVFTAAGIDVPTSNPGFLVYQALISVTTPANATVTGPVSLYATAYSN